MPRVVYSMQRLGQEIPEIENKRHELVTEESLVYVFALVDQWAASKNLVLSQVLSIPTAGTFFIFTQSNSL